MTREELLDNLAESCRRGELVTLTLRPVTGQAGAGDRVVVGRIAYVAEHYTSRRGLIAVVDCGPGRLPLAIGMSMVKDFRTGGSARQQLEP